MLRPFNTFPPLLILLLLASLPPAKATAQQVHLPVVGRQFIQVGLEGQIGLLFDSVDESAEVLSSFGYQLTLGLQHQITPSFAMNLETGLGASHFADHPIAPRAPDANPPRFDGRLSVLARRFPIGPDQGLTFAGGLTFRQIHLPDWKLLQFGPDLRIGYFTWPSEERFLLIELALFSPLLEGLNRPDFFNEGAPLPTGWTLPALRLGVQWSF